MRRILIALTLIAGSAFMAAPAVAEEAATGSTESVASSEAPEPKQEEQPPPKKEEPPPPPKEETPPPPKEEEPPPPPKEEEQKPTPAPAETTAPTESNAGTATVRLCHSTGPGSFESATVDAAAVSSGHAGHADDVIPAFDGYAGKNLGAGGQAVLDNGCVASDDATVPDLQTAQALAAAKAVDVLAVNDKKVSICHSTSAEENPYNSNTPNKSGDVQGHASHTGGVFPADGWGDIIPPFTYGDDDEFSFPGLNWTAEGQAIFNNGCNVPEGPPDPEPGEISLCHATGPDTWEPASATANATAGGHDGDAGDIIPSFDLDPGPGSYPGQNFDAEGEAIFNNNCEVPSGPVDPDVDKVTICHSTSAEDNPYITNTPNKSGDVQGHADHTGGVFPDDPWGDIIPPFTYGDNDEFSFPGLNWTAEGQAIYNAGCVATPPPSDDDVQLCHFTGVAGDPFDLVTTDVDGALEHTDGHPNDVIPPLVVGQDVIFAGQNYDADGQALLANGCNTPPDPVDICHATDSPQMPYVQNSPDGNGTVSGHAGHTGPVFFPGADSWGDIIPPFDYGDGLHFDGLNWTDAGMAIYANGCVPEDAPPGDPEILICHATGDDDDPYVRISPSVANVLNVHAGHDAPVFDEDDDDENWGDIIPPFAYGLDLFFDGLNWNEDGQEIFDDDCTVEDDDDDDDGDDDGDEGDDNVKSAGLLPDTGGSSLWTLLMGGLLTVLGMTILTNRESMGRIGLFGPVPADASAAAWQHTTSLSVPPSVQPMTATSRRGRWTVLGVLAVLAAVVLGRRALK